MDPTSPRQPSAVDTTRAAPPQTAAGEEPPSGLLSGRSVRTAKRGRDDKSDDEGARTASIKRAPPKPLDLRDRATETLAPYAGMPTHRVETKAPPMRAPHAPHAPHARQTPAVSGVASLPLELQAIITAYASTDSRHPEGIFNILRDAPLEVPLPPDIADFIHKQFPPEFHAMRQEWLDRLRSPATRIDDPTLRSIPLILRSDREIFLEAIRREGNALRHASDELRNDRDFCLHAVKIESDAFEHVSPELRDDREICMTAIMQDASNIRYASTRLRSDPLVYWPAIRAGADLSDLPPELLTDPELCLTYLSSNTDIDFAEVPREFLDDLEFAKRATMLTGVHLNQFSPRLRENPKFCLHALAAKPADISHVPERLRRDARFWFAAVAPAPPDV